MEPFKDQNGVKNPLPPLP